MRTISLGFLLVGVLVYLLPWYRQVMPGLVPFGNDATQPIAAVLVLIGLATMVLGRPRS